jgi:hypothetical protein
MRADPDSLTDLGFQNYSQRWPGAGTFAWIMPLASDLQVGIGGWEEPTFPATREPRRCPMASAHRLIIMGGFGCSSLSLVHVS